MKVYAPLAGLLMLCVATAASAASPTIDALRWHRRVLLVAAPTAQDAKAVKQRAILSAWARQGADRDVSLVEVFGKAVIGVADSAASLQRRYHLNSSTFQALLIGKDGHVALRSAQPIGAEKLEGTIDAMPMRKAGQR